MDKVLSPLAIAAFRKFSGKGFSALGHLVWCVMAFLSGAAPRGWLQVEALLRSGFCTGTPARSSLGFTLQGPQRPCPLSFCCCRCLLLPRDGPGSETEGSEDPGEKCPLSQLASLPPSRSTRDYGSPHVPL